MAKSRATTKERRSFLFKTLGALGLGGAILVGHGIRKSRLERQALKAAIERWRPELENKETWARIGQACRWNPEQLPTNYIDLLSRVSSRREILREGITPERVAYTLAENPRLNTIVWQNRLAVRERQGLGDPQAERVIMVLKAFSTPQNERLARELGSKIKTNRIKSNLRAIAAQ
jgi:hypothetical protein